MPFGEDGENRNKPLRICCGPRCGAEPGHRAIYRAIEKAAHCLVEPTLCRALCGAGVTVVLPSGEKRKARSVQEAATSIIYQED